MMASYQPYLSITITHSFFTSNLAQQIHLVPTSATQKWLEKNQMFIKNTAGGIGIFFHQDALKATPSIQGSQHLQFKLFSGDAYFRNYTNIPLPHTLCTAEFDIIVNHTENLEASPKQWLSPEQLLDYPKNIISPYDISQNLVGLINLEISADQYFEANKHITLSYEHCETYWKYYFFSIKYSDQLLIDDPKKTYSFEFQELEQMNGRNNVITFHSNTPIPMQQRRNIPFQLRDQYQLILRALPIAHPKNIEIITQENTYHRLCHIYVA
ncbi:hypothetical protein [Marinomonas spartinae]|nr:hypothetical protein [Marinomonas spartinae]